MIAHKEGILLFLIRSYYCLELPLLACLLACSVSDVVLEKFGLLYFFSWIKFRYEVILR